MYKHIILLMLGFSVLLPQHTLKASNAVELMGSISGMVKDEQSGAGIEYATIALYNQANDAVVDGVVTNIDGYFNLSKLTPGIYYLKISFLGFENRIVRDVEVKQGAMHVKLGLLVLKTSSTKLAEVEVVGQQRSVEYKIDKKVVNVGKQYSSASMSAVEVLENIPSVKVDIEGNVTLRGSGGFTVLIDGKPTVLESSDALRQIPANTIENIEIITNPSAKYQPDGTAGIINIITKKGTGLEGLNGQLSLNVGMYNRLGSDLLLNYRTKKISYTLGGDINRYENPGHSESERITQTGSVSSILLANGQLVSIREGWNLNGGMRVDVDKDNSFGIGLMGGTREYITSGLSDYRKYTIPASFDSIYKSSDYASRGGANYSINGDYLHAFNALGHQLKLLMTYSFRDMNEYSSNELKNADDQKVEGTNNFEEGPGRISDLKLEYTLPFSKTNKFEAGYQRRTGRAQDISGLDSFMVSTGDYAAVDRYSHDTKYSQNINGLYAIYSGAKAHWGYQLGLRGEYTYRKITSTSTPEIFTIDEFNFFPTLHSSYKINDNHQLMASFSRRIERPRGFLLEPFVTWVDAYNVRMGNPNLQPELIDAYEVNFLKSMEFASISLESYFRQTHNKTEYLQSVYQQDVLMVQPVNVGNDYALGLESSLNITKIKWWEMNIMADLYQYKMIGQRYGNDYSAESFNWGFRMNNTFKLPFSSQLQFNSSYNSATVTSQGERAASYGFNAAYRIDMFKRKLSAIVSGRDIFGTEKREQTNQDAGFYSHSLTTMDAPYVTLTVSYRFNNFKPAKEGKGAGQAEGGGGEDL